MSIRRVHVHGPGRPGPAAWPSAGADAEFVSFPARMTVADQAQSLLDRFGGERMLLFAHSIGAVPVALAATRLDLAGLVLVEPAFYDLARGDQAIEHHIAAVTEARSQADAGNLVGFWTILRPLMFGGPFEAATWDKERPVAEHWATTNVPWGHGIRSGMLHGIRTLVVTGGWNDEYEAIARVLTAEGAQHVVLAGAQHRPMDLPRFADAVRAFEQSL